MFNIFRVERDIRNRDAVNSRPTNLEDPSILARKNCKLRCLTVSSAKTERLVKKYRLRIA